MGKANKIFRRSMAAVLSLTALLGATACGGGGGGDEGSDKTVIKVANFGGGVGKLWIEEAFARFSKDYENVEVTPGKTGLYLDMTSTTSVKVKNLNTQTQHMFFVQDKYSSCFEEITVGNVLNINDIVTDPLTEYGETRSIEDKIAEEYRFAMKGNDGNYYMLPHYEIIGGASYDYALFKKYGWFLAKAEQGNAYSTTLLPGKTYYFTNDPAKMSVGNDGKAGTDDDGMPTTLDELVAQCAKIKNDGVPAFSVSGGHIDYLNNFIDCLWTSLAGYEQKNALVAQTGTVDYVTGVSTTELWPGTKIYKPVTQQVALAEDCSNGYAAVNQKGKYYAYAFIELAYQQGWFYDRYKETNYNHQAAMEYFTLNGLKTYPELGSHIEGSYWYNECEGYGYFNDYSRLTKTDIKDIRHWHMPTAYEGGEVVTSEANARDEAITNITTPTMLINKKAIEAEGANSEAVAEICKKFFRFLCTEQELKNFTACTGVAKALFDYDINDAVLEELDPYQQSIMKMRGNGEQYPMVNQYANNPVARYQSSVVTTSANCETYKIDFTGFATDGTSFSTVLSAYYELEAKGKPTNAFECFKVSGKTPEKWAEVVAKANSK